MNPLHPPPSQPPAPNPNSIHTLRNLLTNALRSLDPSPSLPSDSGIRMNTNRANRMSVDGGYVASEIYDLVEGLNSFVTERDIEQNKGNEGFDGDFSSDGYSGDHSRNTQTKQAHTPTPNHSNSTQQHHNQQHNRTPSQIYPNHDLILLSTKVSQQRRRKLRFIWKRVYIYLLLPLPLHKRPHATPQTDHRRKIEPMLICTRPQNVTLTPANYTHLFKPLHIIRVTSTIMNLLHYSNVHSDARIRINPSHGSDGDNDEPPIEFKFEIMEECEVVFMSVKSVCDGLNSNGKGNSTNRSNERAYNNDSNQPGSNSWSIYNDVNEYEDRDGTTNPRHTTNPPAKSKATKSIYNDANEYEPSANSQDDFSNTSSTYTTTEDSTSSRGLENEYSDFGDHGDDDLLNFDDWDDGNGHDDDNGDTTNTSNGYGGVNANEISLEDFLSPSTKTSTSSQSNERKSTPYSYTSTTAASSSLYAPEMLSIKDIFFSSRTANTPKPQNPNQTNSRQTTTNTIPNKNPEIDQNLLLKTLKTHFALIWSHKGNRGKKMLALNVLLESVFVTFPRPTDHSNGVGGGGNIIQIPGSNEYLTIPYHEYFKTYSPPPPSSQYNQGSTAASTAITKKQLRRLKFFLHPDKIPRDFDFVQRGVMCVLWDVISEAEGAWEVEVERDEEFDWMNG